MSLAGPSSQKPATKNGGLSPHALEVLLAAAPDRTNTQNNLPSAESSQSHVLSLPPLESLVEQDKNQDPKIVADVQFLLDFAVVGFGKCGTTSLLHWLQQKDNTTETTTGTLVRAPNYEAQFLRNKRPAQLVRKMYQFGVEEQEARNNNKLLPHEKIVKGFKNPSDIRRPKSRDLLTQYWPQTKLIVTVRHPVEWMVSLYNYFKIEKGRHKATLTAADMVTPGARDKEGDTQHFVSSAKGEFHAILAEIGKTPLASTDEWKLLRPWLNPSQKVRIQKHHMPHSIFLMEMKQLADTNTTRSKQFANDLEAFLGLPQNHLPPPLHVRPNTQRVKGQDNLEDLKMDICAPEFAPVLEEMVSIARAGSQWLREYFMASPEVTVSSPEYINELFERWMIDPCETSNGQWIEWRTNVCSSKHHF